MNGGLRCFVALDLPKIVRESVAVFFAREGRGIAGVRWTNSAHLHLTLKFLGEIAADLVPPVCAALDGALADQGPFALELCGAGAFPSVQRPRVLWVGTGTGSSEAVNLAAAVERSCAPLGIAPERRVFTPHLTIGRAVAPTRARAAIPRLIASVHDRVWGEAVIPAVHLVRSQLFPAGPIYSILHTVRLPAPAQRQL